jgi:hypothetical protein
MPAKPFLFPQTPSRVHGDTVRNPKLNYNIHHPLTQNDADDLLPWGYYFSGVTTDYSNLETGGYWGVADLFRHMGISDRCEQDGGQWYAGSFTHYKPGPPGYAPELPKNQQTYVDPHGVTRRVSIHTLSTPILEDEECMVTDTNECDR